MATSNVLVSRSGTGWTVDVTACNLDTSLSNKDFVVLHNGTPYTQLNDYTKTTPTILTYSGTALGTGTTVEVRRKTPTTVIQPVTYGSRFSSDLWNKELDRNARWKEEADLNGVGAAFAAQLAIPDNGMYGTLWASDTVKPPTRKAVYDKVETLAPINSPAFTGTPTTPDTAQGSNGDTIVNSDRLLTELGLKANLSSPALSGTPTAPTAAKRTNNTQLATTAYGMDTFVKQGGGVGQTDTSNIFIGWSAASKLKATVDITDLGNLALESWVTNYAFSNRTNTGGTIVVGNTRVQWGSSVLITNGGGDAGINYPIAFSSNIVFPIAMNGEAQGLIISINSASVSNVSFTIRATYAGGTVAANVTVRVNWVSFGAL